MDRKKEEINSVKFREGNISIVLDSYDDLFSDFDPRPYFVRALSDDFLLECKKAAAVKKKNIELRLLLPSKKRNFSDELKIKKRLKEYFLKHFREKHKELNKIRFSGLFWFIAGAIVMILAPLLFSNEHYLFRVLAIMSEPAGWFFFWEGLGRIFIPSKSEVEDYKFYKKMANVDISFFNY
jgi:hypothetical protein